ncbi:hypothetical protein PYCC9005_002470 [Savitreella phatthalungensis]
MAEMSVDAQLAELSSLLSDQFASQSTRILLERAETELPGYYGLLLQIALTPQIAETTRLQASIQLKNGIDKHWRKSSRTALSDEEKERIRARLLDGCDRETVPDRVAAQLFVATARVARIDYPTSWAGLFRDIASRIDAARTDEETLVRVLRLLLQVVKSLVSVRLPRAREHFQQTAPELLRIVAVAYDAFEEQVLEHFESCTIATILVADLAIKTARRLICSGYELPYQDELCRRLFTRLCSDFDRVWNIVSGLEMRNIDPRARDELLRRHIVHHGKLFLELASNSALESIATNPNFVLMPGSMELVRRYWAVVVAAAEVSSRNHGCIRKVVLQGMQLVKSCLKLVAMPSVSMRLINSEATEEIRCALSLLGNSLFAPDSLTQMLENLIIKFFVLKAEDFGDWENDPEGWMLSQEASHWQYEVRPCAERVFEDLFSTYKRQLTQPLLEVLAQYKDSTIGQEVLIKEALYSALGISAQHLDEHFDFEAFIPHLERDTTNKHLPAIVRRRVSILLAQWFSVKCSEQARPFVYAIIANELASQEDGVALAAGSNVHAFLDDWDWQLDSFRPFAAHYARSLARLLSLAEHQETKMKIISGLGLIFERSRNFVKDEVEGVLSIIQQQWDEARDEQLLAVAMLGLLTRIVTSQSDRSVLMCCYPVVAPLIRHGTNASNIEHIYLMEEALELLHALLQSASEPDETLVQLFSIVLEPQCLRAQGESLRKLLYITESGCLLLGDALCQHGQACKLIEQLVVLLGGFEAAAISHVAKALDTVIITCGLPAWDPASIRSVIFAALQTDDSVIVEVCRMLVLARLLITDAKAVTTAWEPDSSHRLSPARMVEHMTEKFDSLSHPKHRKLVAMAATVLVLDSTDQIIKADAKVIASLGFLWSHVLAEVQSQAGEDRVFWPDDTALQAVEDGIDDSSAEIARRQQLHAEDPVCATRFRVFVRAAMQVIDVSLLGESFASLLD